MGGCAGSLSSYKFTLVGGTWSFDNSDRDATAWWNRGAFRDFLIGQGLTPARDNPFIWSTDVNGGFRWPWQRERFRDWASAGAALEFYIEEVPPAARLVIAHSHGGNVALWAAANGTTLARLVTVGTPVRRDMRAIADRARPYLGYWLHVAVQGDRMQRWGELFDGRLGWRRTFPQADRNVLIPETRVGHSGLLNDPTHFHHWYALLEYLACRPAAPPI